MTINKKTKELINGVEGMSDSLKKTINENVCELIEENLNRHNEDVVKIALGNPILLCYRKSRAKCFGSFDFKSAVWLEYDRDHHGVWILDDNDDGIDLLENMPLENAMEIFNAVVDIIKRY